MTKSFDFIIEDQAVARISGYDYLTVVHMDLFKYHDCRHMVLTKLKDWIKDNCLGDWQYLILTDKMVFTFSESEDALRFKLTWL